MNTNANGNALLQLCLDLIDDWAVQQFDSFLHQVGESFLQASLATQDETQQSCIFRDYKRIEKDHPLLLERFANSNPADGDQSVGDSIATSASEYPQLLASLREAVGDKTDILQHHLNPDFFVLRCRQVFRDGNFDTQSEGVALGFFHEHFLCSLPSLYKRLQQELPQLIDEARRQTGIHAWITHIEEQLNDPDLSSSKRSMALARLRDLRRQLSEKPVDTLPVSLRDRWSTAYPETNGKKEVLSESYLTQQADELFQSLGPRESLPESITQLLQHLHPALARAARHDRTLFCLPLHPARQLVDSLATVLEHWPAASDEQQQQINQLLRQVIKRIVSEYREDSTVFRQLCHTIEPSCRRIIQSVREYQQRQLAEAERRLQALTPIRSQVDALLNDKRGREQWPPTLEMLLRGPLRDLLVELYFQYGADSERAQRAIRLVDDLLWYVRPHGDWQTQKKAAIIGEQLERELLNGFRFIDFDLEKGRELIGNLHRLQLLGNRSNPQKGYDPSQKVPGRR